MNDSDMIDAILDDPRFLRDLLLGGLDPDLIDQAATERNTIAVEGVGRCTR